MCLDILSLNLFYVYAHAFRNTLLDIFFFLLYLELWSLFLWLMSYNLCDYLIFAVSILLGLLELVWQYGPLLLLFVGFHLIFGPLQSVACK